MGGNWGKDVELVKGWFKVPSQLNRLGKKKKIIQIKFGAGLLTNTHFTCVLL